MNKKPAKKYMIHAYKYNGWLYRTVEYPYFLYETKNVLCLYLPGHGIHSIKSEEDNKRNFHYLNLLQKFWFFFKKHWFNIIVNVFDNRYSFYVNIASPYIVEENAVKYIDFDLDFRIQNNNSYKLLDENELEVNAQNWNYPKELLQKIEETKNEIIDLIQSGWFEKLFNFEQLQYTNKIILKKFAQDPELKKYIASLNLTPGNKQWKKNK